MDRRKKNFFDIRVTGGGQQSGAELSYITPAGGSAVPLPSSDWGFDYDVSGTPGDGIQRLYLDTNPAFQGITSFTVTSTNAYCFGLDDFYIDQAAPPPVGGDVPEPMTMLAMGLGIAGLGGYIRKRRMA